MTPVGGPEIDVDLHPEGLARVTTRAVLWNVVLVPLLGLLALVSSALVARALSIDDYRVYGLAVAAVTSILLWSDLGITSAVARYTPQLRRYGVASTVSVLRRAAKVRIAAVVFLVAALVAGRYLSTSLQEELPFRGASLFLIVGTAMFQSIARVLQYFLTGLFQRKAVGLILLVSTAAQSLLVILAALLGASVTGILGALCLAALLELVLSRWSASREAAAWRRPSDAAATPPGVEAEAARFAAVAFAEKVASYLNSASFVIFLIAGLGAPAEVAFFAVASEFTMRFVSLLSTPFSGITLPLFSSVDSRNDPGQSAAVLRLYLMLLLLLFVPTAALLSSVADPLLPLVYGDRYRESVVLLRILVPFLFLEYTVYSALLAALMTRGRYRHVLSSKLPLLLGVPVVAWVIPHWGATGAVLALGCVRLGSAGLLLLAGMRELRFRFPGVYAAKVLVASLGSVAAIAALRGFLGDGGLALGLLLVAGGVGFLLLYKAFGGMAAADREQMVVGLPESARFVRYFL